MKFGEKLILLRRQHSMSQEELAEKLNVSRQTISKWENETASPSSENMSAIGRLFGTPVDVLVDDRAELPLAGAGPVSPDGEPDAGKISDGERTAFPTFMKGVICAVCALAVAISVCIGIYLFVAQERNDDIIPIEEAQRDKIELLPDLEITLSPLEP